MRRMNRKIGGYTDSRKGIFADAVSNCLLPFLSSLPTCASFNRMWLVHTMGGQSRLTSAVSALFLLLMVLFLAKVIAIIPMPAMAAVIMVLGANMINWEDIRPHFQSRREATVFVVSFLSVLFLDLFEAVLVGSALAIAYSKWEQAHPNISLRGNVLKIRGNIYYGSLPVIESTYHKVLARTPDVIVDFSECYYIDQEGIRWLAALKARRKAAFVDRRRGDDRRDAAPHASDRSGERRGESRQRRRQDRRRRTDI
jgi:sulfate permease, SulP family